MAIYCIEEGINCLECTNQLKKARGCSEEINGQFAGFEINRCPRRFVSMTEMFRLQAFGMFQKGFLPNDGTWLSQPNKFFDFCNEIERILKEIEDKRTKTNGR